MRLTFAWLGLVLLLGSTALLSYMPLGWGNTAIALFIACVKAAIVAAVFMELDKSKTLVRICAGAGLFWLGILFWFVLNDYATRSGFPPAEQARPAAFSTPDR